MTTLEQYTAALRAFILQRPRFEPANYAGAPAAYRADYSRCLADRNDALALLAYVARSSNPERVAGCFTEALRSSRLEWNVSAQAIDYCTGQYFPTEYRGAACRVLARVIWRYFADSDTDQRYASVNVADAENVRRQVRSALGLRLARRWFN